MEPFSIYIDKNSPIPIYHQIQGTIKRLILDGNLAPHERIPSENELSKQFGISQMTIRQAMSGLVEQGLVYRERGKGTFVAPKRMKHSLERLTGFTEDMKARGLKPTGKILLFEKIAPPSNITSIFGISPDVEVLHIKRLRFSNNCPVGVHDCYLNHGVAFTEDELDTSGSLYALLEDKGIKVIGGLDTIEAIQATKEFSHLLKVPLGSPLLQVTRITENMSGTKLEFITATYRADLYRYTIRLKR